MKIILVDWLKNCLEKENPWSTFFIIFFQDKKLRRPQLQANFSWGGFFADGDNWAEAGNDQLPAGRADQSKQGYNSFSMRCIFFL